MSLFSEPRFVLAGPPSHAHPRGVLLRGVGVAVWLVTASACGTGDGAPSSDGPSAAAVPASGSWIMTCPNGDLFGVRFDADSAYVDQGIRAFSFPRVPAASGARYSDDGREIWSRGTEVTVALPGVERQSCDAVGPVGPWEGAALLGVDFRGLGQEPGWILDIDLERWILYVGDYATVRFAAPVPEPDRDVSGVVTFDAETEVHHLIVRIEPTPCNDSMSGQPFSHTVRLDVDGRVLSGCGRFVGALTDFEAELP
jgi:uncharacterized membrane protein